MIKRRSIGVDSTAATGKTARYPWQNREKSIILLGTTVSRLQFKLFIPTHKWWKFLLSEAFSRLKIYKKCFAAGAQHDDHCVKRILEAEVYRRRNRGRQRKRCINTISHDLISLNLTPVDVEDRDDWRRRTRVADPSPEGYAAWRRERELSPRSHWERLSRLVVGWPWKHSSNFPPLFDAFSLSISSYFGTSTLGSFLAAQVPVLNTKSKSRRIIA